MGLLHAFDICKGSLFIGFHTWTIRFNGICIPNFQVGFRHYIVPHYIYVCLGPSTRTLKRIGKTAYRFICKVDYYQG